MRRALRWIRNGVLLLVIAAFVLLYGQGQGGVAPGTVVEIDGEAVSRELFEAWRERHAQAFSELDGLEPDQLRELIDARTIGTLVQRLVLAREARALGFQVSNAALRRSMLNNPQYQNGGIYDPELVERSAAQLGFSTRQYLEEIRNDLLLQDFERLVSSPVRISKARVRAAIREGESTLRLRYAVAETADFQAEIKLAPEAVQEFLESHAEQIEAEYDRRRSEFQRPEQVVARHILFTGPDAMEQARRARARLAGGEGFADLALELSQDEATREQAGLLGAFPRGRMLPAFEEAAFALEQPGDISEPVETERGAHLILLEARQEAVSRGPADVTPELAHALLLEERAAEAARKAARELLGKLAEDEPFVAAAEASGLRIGLTSSFALSEPAVTELREVEGVIEAAHSLSLEHPHAQRVFSDADSFYVISLLERNEPDPQAVEDRVAAMSERLTEAARDNTAQVWLEHRRRELEESGELRVYPLYPGN